MNRKIKIGGIYHYFKGFTAKVKGRCVMTEIINNRVKVDFEWIYADFRSEIGVLIEHPEVFKISVEGGKPLNCSNLKYADVKKFINNIRAKNGAHIIVHTNGLKDDSEATIICCVSEDSKGDALKDTVWKYIKLQNRMGRMPKIAIGDTVEFNRGYPKGNVVRIHSYSDTFFVDFEI